MPNTQTAREEVPGPAGTPHSRSGEVLYQLCVTRHRIRRGIADFFDGCRRCERMNDRTFSMILGESRSALWADDRAAEASYQEGKVHNLRIAVRELDCALLLPGQVFSFWRQIGRATRKRGYVVGRMLQQGCLVPAVGGGLCQLSNALYDAALQAGCEILERHAHSRVVPGSAAAGGRDATVAWNYVDLRFRSRVPLLIRAGVSEKELAVLFCASPGTLLPRQTSPTAASDANPENNLAHRAALTCATCSTTACFRRER